MQTLHVYHTYTPEMGGANTAIRHFLAALTGDGFRSRLIAFNARPETVPQGYDVIAVPSSRGPLGSRYHAPLRGSCDGLERYVARADVVFVHLLYRFHAAWAAETAAHFGKPLVVVPHGGLDPYCFTYRAALKRIWLRHYRRALVDRSTFLFATEREKEKASSVIGPLRAAQFSWPCALPERRNGRLAAPNGARRRLLFAGRLHPMKRVLETVRSILRAGIEMELILVGSESEQVSIDELRRQAGSEWGDRVVYYPACDPRNLTRFYDNADALVLFSHRENFGYVVAEAMAHGLPVFLSEGVDLAPIVEAQGCGRAFDIGGETDIDQALRHIAALDAATLRTMGANGAEAARRLFSWPAFVANTRLLAEELAGRN